MGGIKTEDKIQIEHAARGCVSGSLAEWPYLDAALRRLDINLPLATNATALKFVCRGLVEAWAERERRERAEGAVTSAEDAHQATCEEFAEARDRIATLEAEAGALRAALVEMTYQYGGTDHHPDDCPNDGECNCALMRQVDAALASSAGAGVALRGEAEELRRGVERLIADHQDCDDIEYLRDALKGLLDCVDARDSLPVAAELEAGRALVEALPKCDRAECGRAATRHEIDWNRALSWRCDVHGKGVEELPYAVEVRALEAARAKRGGA